MGRSIDLNADMGEFANAESRAIETALMALVSSCSIACGGHAGNAETMGVTAQLAKAHGVNTGAHPSYPDRKNFGRRSMEIDDAALRDAVKNQIDSLRNVLREETMTLSHIKPHGALYNDAARDDDLARILAETAGRCALMGPPDSALERAARKSGVRFIAEGFVDRLYQRDGRLTSRSEPGAVIDELEIRAKQATAIALGQSFPAADGELRLEVDTLCIHSDSAGAVETARAIRAALDAEGVSIAAAL